MASLREVEDKAHATTQVDVQGRADAAWLLPGSLSALIVAPTAWEKAGEWPAPEAKQAAAADERFLYAVTNTLVAKYDRETGTAGGRQHRQGRAPQ